MGKETQALLHAAADLLKAAGTMYQEQGDRRQGYYAHTLGHEAENLTRDPQPGTPRPRQVQTMESLYPRLLDDERLVLLRDFLHNPSLADLVLYRCGTEEDTVILPPLMRDTLLRILRTLTDGRVVDVGWWIERPSEST